MKFLKFNRCPVCNSSSYSLSEQGYLNLYSEQVSLSLKINEKKLNETLQNLRCNKCNLIYKKVWFDKKVLKNIFNKIVSTHPKGWDTKSKKFSKKYFANNIKNLKKNIGNNKENLKENRIIRELVSIVDSISISKKNLKGIKKRLIEAIQNKNMKSINHNFAKLKNEFKSPEEFKRFKGFDSTKLTSYVKSKIGRIDEYSELGCPLWGSISSMNRDNVKCSFIKGQPYQFWGLNCKKNKILCHKKLESNVKKFNNIPSKVKKIDYLAVYLFLDHVINPINFMRKIFRYSNSVGIIVERSNKGVPIQHFTGWDKNSMKFLAKKLNKKIDYSFKPIKKTGKDFYLIY